MDTAANSGMDMDMDLDGERAARIRLGELLTTPELHRLAFLAHRVLHRRIHEAAPLSTEALWLTVEVEQYLQRRRSVVPVPTLWQTWFRQ